VYLTTALILIATASVISSTNGSDGSVHENPAICTKYKEDGKTISMKSQILIVCEVDDTNEDCLSPNYLEGTPFNNVTEACNPALNITIKYKLRNGNNDAKGMWIKKSTLLTYNGTAIDTPELDYHYLAPKQGKWSVHQRTVNTCAQENTVIPLSATLRVQDALTQPNLHNYCYTETAVIILSNPPLASGDSANDVFTGQGVGGDPPAHDFDDDATELNHPPGDGGHSTPPPAADGTVPVGHSPKKSKTRVRRRANRRVQ
jgi:hypothetical protein